MPAFVNNLSPGDMEAIVAFLEAKAAAQAKQGAQQ
jgi:hypothetical protein